MFTKRHYEWLARWAGSELNQAMRESLADELARDNPNFKRAVFLSRCTYYGLGFDKDVSAQVAALMSTRT